MNLKNCSFVLEQYFEACERFLELESTRETRNKNWRAIDNSESAQAVWILAKLETKLFLFTFMWPCIVTNFFIIIPRDALISQIYFVYKMNLYMFRAVPLPIMRSSFTVHLALVYAIQVWRQLSSRAKIPALLESCLQTCMTYTNAKCTVSEFLMRGRGTARNM